jgi:hypothetical protein
MKTLDQAEQMTAYKAVMTLESRSICAMGQTVHIIEIGPYRGRWIVEWTQYGRTWYQWDVDFLSETG